MTLLPVKCPDIEFLIPHLKHQDPHLYEALLRLTRCKVDLNNPDRALPPSISFVPTFDDAAIQARYGYITLKNITKIDKSSLPDDITEIEVILYYVNERTASLNFAAFAANMNATDSPVTVVTTVAEDVTNGLQILNGDFCVVNDSTQNPSITTRRNYEIFKVIGRSGTAPNITFILSRGQLGSIAAIHTAPLRLYKVEKGVFGYATGKEEKLRGKLRDRQPVYWPSTCVVAISAVLRNDVGFGTRKLLNMNPTFYPFPGNVHQNPPAPGARTCLGSCWTLTKGGVLVVNGTPDFTVRLTEPHSIRYITAEVGVPPAGAAIKIDARYVAPRGVGEVDADRKTAKFETLTIPDGARESWDPADMPRDRRTPYILTWPPTTLIRIDDATKELAMLPDGELTFLVTQVGSGTAGSDLKVFFHT